jgi:hypothetical protein
MDSTAIATTMPPGRYGARHIPRWSVSVASCVCSRRIGPADTMVIAVAVV